MFRFSPILRRHVVATNQIVNQRHKIREDQLLMVDRVASVVQEGQSAIIIKVQNSEAQVDHTDQSTVVVMEAGIDRILPMDMDVQTTEKFEKLEARLLVPTMTIKITVG